MEAIRIALRNLLVHKDSFNKIVLLSDSQVAIQDISSPSLPSSVGNEEADILAKRGSRLSYNAIRFYIKNYEYSFLITSTRWNKIKAIASWRSSGYYRKTTSWSCCTVPFLPTYIIACPLTSLRVTTWRVWAALYWRSREFLR